MTGLGETPPREEEAPGRRGYHHGHLAEALIAATKGLLAQTGPIRYSAGGV